MKRVVGLTVFLAFALAPVASLGAPEGRFAGRR